MKFWINDELGYLVGGMPTLGFANCTSLTVGLLA